MKKARIISLGCAKNLVDTEILMGMLKEKNYDFTPYEEDADLILINTCAFISPALKETEENILGLKKYKTLGKKIIVCGCYVERFKDKLKEKFPFVDLFIGPGEYQNFSLYLENSDSQNIFSSFASNFLYSADYKRFHITPRHWTYVKISEGCNNLCNYCTIPYIRGPLRSRPIEDIKKEVKALINNGVKEINLIAQDTTRYGEDIYGRPFLLNLLKTLDDIPGDFMIRILYSYPSRLSKEILDFIKISEKIVPYFDIPLQHVNNQILRSMGRNYTKEQIINLWEQIRKTFKESVLRTTFIIGFPGEGEEEFKELLDFIENYPFERVGVFSFYPEKGTKAYNMPNQVDEKIKKERIDILMKKQQRISKKLNETLIGKIFDVYIERKMNNYYLGRSFREAPEVDPWIIIKDPHLFNIGEKIKIEIIKAGIYDLWGRRV
ncbi:MAG: 30S ribosomal protein S12 methylthiotransferase RimO [Dictyoglomaceae bacterium]